MKVLRAKAANEFNLFFWFKDNFLHATKIKEEVPAVFIEHVLEPLSGVGGAR